MKIQKVKISAAISILALLFAVQATAQIKDEYDFRALVFSGHDRYHYKAIPDAIKGLEQMAGKYQFKMDWTLLQDVFDSEQLFTYDVVVFLSARGEDLTASQRDNFRKFINQGGGFVGIHSVGGGDWEWFNKLMGRQIDFHPPQQYAVMNVIDKNHPATMHLPDRILWTDEWYVFEEALTEGMHVLMTLDESTYQAQGFFKHEGKPGMGDFHPICWYQEYDGGRSFYTGAGHGGEFFQDQDFLLHIYGAMLWAATGIGIETKD